MSERVRILELAKRLHKDLFAHNLVSASSAAWVKTPEGIAAVLQAYLNDKNWTKIRIGHMEFERRPNSITVRICVSQRRIILKTSGNR